MPTAHAKLSASGSSRWLNCPGSVKLEESLPDASSPYAVEGTLAHSAAELKLNMYFKKGIGPKKYKSQMDTLKASEYWDKSMDDYTDVYVDHIKARALAYEEKPFIDFEVRVDFSDVVPEGFGTCDCVMIQGTELNIIDLKYGAGVKVDAEKNTQLMLYALGAYKMYSLLYDIQTVHLTIAQPRLDHFETFTLTTPELKEFGEMIKPIAEEAYRGSDRLQVGEHCRFCKAKPKCRARAEEMFGKIKTNIEPIKDKEPSEILTSEEMGELLDKVDGVVDWIKSLEAEALSEALKGNKVTGYKLVEGRSVRKITDETEAVNKLVEAGYEEPLLYEKKLLSMTKLEKIVGKKEFSAILGDVIEKPQGKPTLVKVSDKRKEMVVDDPKILFKGFIEN